MLLSLSSVSSFAGQYDNTVLLYIRQCGIENTLFRIKLWRRDYLPIYSFLRGGRRVEGDVGKGEQNRNLDQGTETTTRRKLCQCSTNQVWHGS